MAGKGDAKAPQPVRVGCMCHLGRHKWRAATWHDLACAGLPCLAVLAGVCHGGGRAHAPVVGGLLDTFAVEVDWYIRHCGTLLPLVLPLVRSVAGCGSAAGRHVFGSLLSFVIAGVLRVIFYSPVALYKCNYYFSDHIFLCCCIAAMASAGLADCRSDKGLSRGLAACISAMLIVCVAVECFVTSAFFHTRQASLTALCVGTVFWGGWALCWHEWVVDLCAGSKAHEAPEVEHLESRRPLLQTGR